MPIDPNIILGIRPVDIKQTDPMDQYAKSLTLKNLMNQGDMQDLALSDERATRNAYMQAGGDPVKTRELLAARGQYKQVQALDKSNLETLERRSIINKNQIETVLKATAQHRDQLAGVNTLQDAAQWIMAGYQDPNLGPIFARLGNPQDVIAKIPQDQEGFNQWKQQKALGATKFIELNKPTIHDAGGQLITMPGLGGIPSKLMDKTQTQDSIASNETTRRGQNMVNQRAIESRNLEATKIDPYGVLGVNKNVPSAVAAGAGLSGDEYLATLAPGVASQVKALAEGKMPMNARTLTSPQGAALLAMAQQYEPGTDATTYNRRNKTSIAFSAGQQGNALKSVNQTIAHMGSLSDAIDNLNNPGGLMTIVNPIVNAAQERTGDPRQGVFRQKALAVSSELRKVFSGSGVGNLEELKQWEASLPLNASKEQQKAYLLSGVELLHGAMDALDTQYKTGMGSNAGIMNNDSLISNKAKQTLAKLQGGANPQSAQVPQAPAGGMTKVIGGVTYVNQNGQWFAQ